MLPGTHWSWENLFWEWVLLLPLVMELRSSGLNSGIRCLRSQEFYLLSHIIGSDNTFSYINLWHLVYFPWVITLALSFNVRYYFHSHSSIFHSSIMSYCTSQSDLEVWIWKFGNLDFSLHKQVISKITASCFFLNWVCSSEKGHF